MMPTPGKKNFGKLPLSLRRRSPGRRGAVTGRPGAALGGRRVGKVGAGRKAKLGFGF